MSRTFTHDPNAVLDYVVDWSDWLDEADSISSHTATATTGVTVASSSVVGDTVVAWLSGGTAGNDYTVTVHITTAANRQDDRTFVLFCRER
jgi:hypothetical protein